MLALMQTACVTINLPPGPGALEEHKVSGTGKDKVLLMDISGVISSDNKESFYTSPGMLATVKEELERAGKDERIKAIVLRINSPGGTVTASDIIYHELKTFKASRNIPVVASIMDVGASGGYYIAAAADTRAGPSLFRDRQHRRDHADRQCQGTLGEGRRRNECRDLRTSAKTWDHRSGRCCRKNARFSKG